MDLFKIREGPWKKLFEGIFQEYEITLFSNPDSVLMVLILEKENEKIIGSVLQLYKIFYSEGETEQFISTLPKNIILIHKHQENVNQKFILLSSKPEYVTWNENEFQKETDEQLKKLSVSTKMIKDISKAYDLELIEMHNASNEIKKAFFSEPLLVPISSTATKITKITEKPAITSKEIFIGITREGKKIEEPIQLINNSIINNGLENDRKNVLQILIEGMLLNKIPVIIFDYKNKFTELSKPNDSIELKEINEEPIGFPMKKFIPGENLFIDLKLINSKALNEFIGSGEKKPAQLISSLIELNEFNSIKELIDSIKKKSPDENYSEYEVHKAKRILQIIELHYNKLLIQKNSLEELIKTSIKGIGKVSLLEMNSIEEKAQLLSTYSLLKLILESLKKEGKTNQIKMIIVLPETQKITPRETLNLLQENLIKMLNELPEYGCGILLETPILNELNQKIIDSSTSTFTIIQGKDIGIQLKNKKSYRAILRPGLSKN